MAAVDGIATRVQRVSEGGAAVLRFLVTAEDGSSAAVEMRGDEIRGLLGDADLVRFTAPARPPADGIHRPLAVENLTTGSLITAWRPSRLQRAGKPLLTMLLSAVVSSLVTLIFAALTQTGGGAPSVEPGPGERDTGGGAAAVVSVVVAVLGVIWFLTFGRRRRRRGKPLWPVVAGLLIGAGLVLALLSAGE